MRARAMLSDAQRRVRAARAARSMLFIRFAHAELISPFAAAELPPDYFFGYFFRRSAIFTLFSLSAFVTDTPPRCRFQFHAAIFDCFMPDISRVFR
jgi:hypothetical protein